MQSEAEKFFSSLPTEQNEEKFDFFEKPKGEEEKKEEVVEEPKIQPEKEEDEEPKRLNRQERRREQNKFWEEQLAHEREARLRLETELLKSKQTTTTQEEDTRLTRLFGDTPQGKEASRIVSELLRETEERAVAPYKELSAERQAEAQLESQFDEQIEEGIETVEDAYGIDLSSRSAKQTRSDFLDFVNDLSPDDSLVNFEKAWPLFQATQKAPKDPETVQRKKDIASRSIQRSTTPRPEVKTTPVSFETLDQESFWSKLTGRK